jgi:hypothetical protein
MPLRGGEALRWMLALWWLTTRRRWRQETGAPLLAVGLAAALAVGAAHAPAGGESLYLTLLLAVGLAAVIGAPLILTGERVLGTERMSLLPLSPLSRWLLEAVFGNPLRTLIVGVVAIWAVAAFGVLPRNGIHSVLHVLQAFSWLVAATTLSQLLEDVIRHSRSVVVHQLLFFAGLATWPLALDYLGDETNFVPPPGWTAGPLGIVLLGGTGPLIHEVAALAVPWLLVGLLVQLDRHVVRDAISRPAPPPASVRWTAGIASLLGAPFRSDPALIKELLVPLRFLFIRMSIVFVALIVVASLVFGLPLLLLSIVFWWQPLSTNALGPDLEGGTTRYSLVGWTPRGILIRRTASMAILSVVIGVVTALVCVLLGVVQPPTMGPGGYASYPIVFTYSISLIGIWGIAGERYSMRYSDPLEMHTLLPERKRSGGAVAVILLMVMWSGAVLLALACLAASYLVLLPLVGEMPLDDRVRPVLLMAAGANVVAYLVHLRRFTPEWDG